MKLLLRRNDIHPDRADFDDRTPLLVTYRNGNEEVLCLEDVNPNKHCPGLLGEATRE